MVLVHLKFGSVPPFDISAGSRKINMNATKVPAAVRRPQHGATSGRPQGLSLAMAGRTATARRRSSPPKIFCGRKPRPAGNWLEVCYIQKR